MHDRLVWLIVLSSFSYPVTTVALLSVGVDTAGANFVLKGIYATFYLTLVLQAQSLRLSRGALKFILFFFLIYGIRLIVDILIFDIYIVGYQGYQILLYFFGLTLLPVVALAANAEALNARIILAGVNRALIACNVAVAIYALTFGASTQPAVLSGRFEIEGGVHGTAVLSPLTVSVIGAMLIAAAAGKLALLPRTNAATTTLYAVSLGIGTLNLFLGASRGPTIGVLVMLLFLAAMVYATKSESPGRASKFFLVAFSAFGAIAYSVSSMDTSRYYLIERIGILFGSRESLGPQELRWEIYRTALEDFLRSPLFGEHFVVSGFNYYPHNIPLEVLMSTGLLGCAVFLLASRQLILSLYFIVAGAVPKEAMILTLVSLLYLVLGMSSGSIHSLPEFWICFALVTLLGNSGRRDRRTRIRRI